MLLGGVHGELVLVSQMRADVEHHLLHGAGEWEGLLVLVIEIHNATVVTSDVHAGIARESDRDRVVHSSLSDLAVVDE